MPELVKITAVRGSNFYAGGETPPLRKLDEITAVRGEPNDVDEHIPRVV